MDDLAIPELPDYLDNDAWLGKVSEILDIEPSILISMIITIYRQAIITNVFNRAIEESEHVRKH